MSLDDGEGMAARWLWLAIFSCVGLCGTCLSMGSRWPTVCGYSGGPVLNIARICDETERKLIPRLRSMRGSNTASTLIAVWPPVGTASIKVSVGYLSFHTCAHSAAIMMEQFSHLSTSNLEMQCRERPISHMKMLGVPCCKTPVLVSHYIQKEEQEASRPSESLIRVNLSSPSALSRLASVSLE